MNNLLKTIIYILHNSASSVGIWVRRVPTIHNAACLTLSVSPEQSNFPTPQKQSFSRKSIYSISQKNTVYVSSKNIYNISKEINFFWLATVAQGSFRFKTEKGRKI